MKRNSEVFLLSTLLIFMIACGPLLAVAAPIKNAEIASISDSVHMKINVADDEAVTESYPDTNWDANHAGGGLFVGYEPIDGMTRSWLKFNLSSIPKEIGINSAILNVYLYDEFSIDDLPIGVHYAGNDSWSETSITWNNQPSFGTSPLDVIDTPSGEDMFIPGNWYSWDVTPAFYDSLNTDKKLSLVLKQIDEESTTATWNYFLEKDYSAATAFNASYISVEYTTPDTTGLTVDGFTSSPLINYVQDLTPIMSWTMADSGTGEFQRDYQLEVWNDENYEDTLLWSQAHDDSVTIHDSSGTYNSRPFATGEPLRYQMKFPAALIPRSGIIDKIMFEVSSSTGEMVFQNLEILMLGVQNTSDLTSDFALNYDGGQPITVLNRMEYTVPIVDGRIIFDIENTFFLHRNLYLIIELRFTDNIGILSTTPYTAASGGSVAYTFGLGAEESIIADYTYDRLHSLDIFFESEMIWDPLTGIGNSYPFGADSSYPGRYQIKYNKSMFQETGVIDKIWIPVQQFSGDVTYENLVIKLAETPRLGELSHSDFESNYEGVTPITVLDRATYHLRNLGYVLVLDLDNSFRYSGEHDLLIDIQWDDIAGYCAVIRDLDSGAYRAWDLYSGGHQIGNDTRTSHMYIDFVHPESSIEYDGTPLANNTTYYWRVRSCDSTGIWSEWTNQSFSIIQLSSVPDFGTLNVNPDPVEAGSPVTVSIDVTYFLGIHSVLLEFDGSNMTMIASGGNEYSVTFSPADPGNYTLTVYMESNVHTWSTTTGTLEVTPAPTTTTGPGGSIDSTLIIIIIGAAGVVIVVVIIILSKKGKS